jgi:hypothetical protein
MLLTQAKELTEFMKEMGVVAFKYEDLAVTFSPTQPLPETPPAKLTAEDLAKLKREEHDNLLFMSSND